MRKQILIAAAALSFLAAPAMAFQCPSDVAKIDQALATNTTLTDAQRAEVVTLRNDGEALHNSGDHTQSVATLAQAKEILGIE
ncbi:MAG: hypothetical protein GY791_11950 [Alphaproteobacteria bacterium]|nr:hypothetical protein [Alphaproteobacteria bacterium]